MALNLEEQEQLASLKVFWNRGGKWLALLFGLGCFSFLAYQGVKSYQASHVAKLTQMWEQMSDALEKKDGTLIESVAKEMHAYDANHGYTQRARLALANWYADHQKIDEAINIWKDVSNSKSDEAASSFADMSLVNVFLDQKKYDEALAFVNKNHPSAFDSVFLMAKGDILIAKNDKKSAKEAYTSAMAKVAQDDDFSLMKHDEVKDILKMKLDALGDI